MMPPGPWLYPEDQITEAPIRSLAAEITREKLFERLHDELPYQATVETDSWKDQPDGSARVEQTVFVTREGHRKIVIGEGGRTIKAIGTAARKDIAEAHGANGASLPACEGARELARRPRALPGDGARVPEGVGESRHGEKGDSPLLIPANRGNRPCRSLGVAGKALYFSLLREIVRAMDERDNREVVSLIRRVTGRGLGALEASLEREISREMSRIDLTGLQKDIYITNDCSNFLKRRMRTAAEHERKSGWVAEIPYCRSGLPRANCRQ